MRRLTGLLGLPVCQMPCFRACGKHSRLTWPRPDCQAASEQHVGTGVNGIFPHRVPFEKRVTSCASSVITRQLARPQSCDGALTLRHILLHPAQIHTWGAWQPRRPGVEPSSSGIGPFSCIPDSWRRIMPLAAMPLEASFFKAVVYLPLLVTRVIAKKKKYKLTTPRHANICTGYWRRGTCRQRGHWPWPSRTASLASLDTGKFCTGAIGFPGPPRLSFCQAQVW